LAQAAPASQVLWLPQSALPGAVRAMSALCRLFCFLTTLAHGALAQSACDSEAGLLCPTSVGKEIGDCLQDPAQHQLTDIDGNPRELEPGEKPPELSSECKNFININKVCDAEIEEHCSSMYFHGDTMTCLSQWVKPEVLGEGCRALMPRREENEGKIDKEKEAWRQQRKAARTQAMKDIEKEKARTEKEEQKNKKRRKKKANKEL